MSEVSSEFFRQGWQFMNRVHLAQIYAVNEAKGTVSVIFLDGIIGKRQDLEIPWGGFSMAGHKSSWIRYMPQVNDLAYVVFGPKNDARVLGFATNEGAYDSFYTERGKNPSKVPSGDFVALRQGEWDLRSAGGAYLYGTRDGALLLAAGPTVQARLDKQNNEARLEAGLWKVGGTGSFLRLGDIKRQIPGEFKETDFSLVDPTAPKEWWLHLEQPVLPGVGLLIADEQLGGVRDGLGVPKVGLGGAPVRHSRKIWVPGQPNAVPIPIPSYSEETDALGNKNVIMGPTATLAAITAPTVSANVSLLNLSVEALAALSLTAVGATAVSGSTATVVGTEAASLLSEGLAVVDAPAVNLGTPGLAIHPAVRGDVLLALLAEVAATAAASFGTIAGLEGGPASPKGAAYTALATAFTALGAGLAAVPSEKVFVE